MIQYFIDSVLVSAILSLAYFVLFYQTKHFLIRRILILLIPVLSLSIPNISKLQILNNGTIGKFAFLQVLDTATINSETLVNQNYDFNTIFLIIYFLIGFLLTIKLVWQIVSIERLKQNSDVIKGVYYNYDFQQSFSFFNGIFIPKSMKEDIDIILKHEKLHIKEKHSFDILFFEILKIVFWFNPIFYQLKKELQNIHEYIVDQNLLEDNINVEKYFKVLARENNLKYIKIGNNFNHSLIKNRFIMMKKNSNTKWIPFKILGMGAIVLASSLIYANRYSGVNILPLETNTGITKQDSTFKFNELDVMPEFPGGTQKMLQFLGKNTKYPEKAKKDGIQGRVYTEFIINEEGLVSNVGIKKSANPELNAEAIRVVSAMPKWKPGEKNGKKVSVYYILPINFKLNSENSKINKK